MIGSSSHSSEDILAMSQVMVATRSQDYGTKNHVIGKQTKKSSQILAISPTVSEPLQIEKPNPDIVIEMSTKGVLQKSAFNPHARATHNYNIVEDLAISPLAMSALEVLKSFLA